MTARRAANGRSSIYREPDGRWRAAVSFGIDPLTGRRLRRKMSGKTRAEVVEKLREVERERDAGILRGRSWTVTQWFEQWVAGKELSVRPRTIESYIVDKKHIDRVIGHHKIEALMPEHVEALYRDMLNRGLSPGTTEHVRRTLSASMRTAVDRGYLIRNPVKLANRPKYTPPEPEPYTNEEARRMIAAAGRVRGGARWLIQLELGLRQGEVLGLRWDLDVDLEGGWLDVKEQLQFNRVKHGCASSRPCGLKARYCPNRTGGGLHRVPVKSAAGKRRLKLSDQLLAALRRHAAEQKRERLAAGTQWHGGSWVFSDELGRPYNAKRDLDRWTAFCLEANVPRRRTHDLRHSQATFLRNAGVPDSVIADTLGHSDIRLVTRYAHVNDRTRQMVSDAMAAILWSDAR